MQFSRPKIVRHKITITESQVMMYGANYVDQRIEDCRQDALNVAKAQKYKNPKVVQETFWSQEYNTRNPDGSYIIKNGWRNLMLPCEYSVTVEDVEI